MKSKWSKLLAMALTGALLAGVLAACGGGDETDLKTADEDTEAAGTTAGAEDDGQAQDTPAPTGDQPYAGTVLKYAVSDTLAETEETAQLMELVLQETGIIIEFTIVPTAKDGEVDKTLVSLQAGDELDLVYGTTSKLKTFYNANVLAPLDDLAAAAGYDMQAVFGEDNLPIFDGGVYGLPAFSDIWLTFINTSIFEQANVEVPSAEGWTWEKYVETAQAITDAGLTSSMGGPVWGSYMLDYDCYNYMLATQKGIQPYKADGTANFDDPAYTEAVEWFYSLGNDLKIQPDITNVLAGTYAWNQFVASDDMAMFVCGGWVASMLKNQADYPRDWECAILPMPYPEGEAPSTLSIQSCYGIPSTSQNKEAAFEALRVIAERQYELGYGRIPARKDLTDEEVMDYVENVLLPSTFEFDSAVTLEDVKAAWFDANRTMLPEKIVGSAESVLSKIWTDEAQLYGTGAQDLATTMANIQQRSNTAIEEEQAS